MNKLFCLLLLSLCMTIGAQAQTIEGDWHGILKAGEVELNLEFHVIKDEKGALKATLDSVDQNAMGLTVSSISFNDSLLKFEIEIIGGLYEGKLNADRTTISGTWSQRGTSSPLGFTRIKARPEPKKKVLKPSDIDGDWEGSLEAGPNKLRLVLHILTYEDGMTAKFDSLDQNVMGLPVTTIVRDGTKLTFKMRQLGGSFEGAINQDLTIIDGTWSQGGGSLPLVLKRTSPASKDKK